MINIEELEQCARQTCLTNNAFLDDTSTSRMKTAAFCYSLRTILGDFVVYIKNMKFQAKCENYHFIEEILQQNIDEEFGLVNYDEFSLHQAGIAQCDVKGVMHSELLEVFLAGLDKALSTKEKVSINKLLANISTETTNWRKEFVESSIHSLSKGIGAVGFGCELVLPNLFDKLLLKIRNDFPEIEEMYLNYFKLHIFVDKEHGTILVDIAKYLNKVPGNGVLISDGFYSLVAIVNTYWDMLINY